MRSERRRVRREILPDVPVSREQPVHPDLCGRLDDLVLARVPLLVHVLVGSFVVQIAGRAERQDAEVDVVLVPDALEGLARARVPAVEERARLVVDHV